MTIRALAKINLALRVVGSRADGYHELRTTFQSIALHDTITLARTRGGLEIACDDPACPSGAANIVWTAAARLWRATGRTGLPRGVRIQIEKRIPMEAGLGGGSADAAAALRGLVVLWRVTRGLEWLRAEAAALGADVPYFLEGGTALGVSRGDVITPLPDQPHRSVVLVVPPFGVSTKEAFEWFDEAAGSPPRRHGSRHSGVHNDLQAAVAARHPDIGRIVRRLKRLGALAAAMSGSGSAVFGLFRRPADAETAADQLVERGRRVIVTRTVARGEYERRTSAALARK